MKALQALTHENLFERKKMFFYTLFHLDLVVVEKVRIPLPSFCHCEYIHSDECMWQSRILKHLRESSPSSWIASSYYRNNTSRKDRGRGSGLPTCQQASQSLSPLLNFIFDLSKVMRELLDKEKSGNFFLPALLG